LKFDAVDPRRVRGDDQGMLRKPHSRRASADFDGRRTERVFDREAREVAIRFSVWRHGKIDLRPLTMPEDELLVLIGEAVAARVFSADFLDELSAILKAQG
jgi:hypothetical protein